MSPTSTAMRDAFADGLINIAKSNPNVIVLDGDVANSTKMDRFAKALPKQFVEVGIAEQNMAGIAAGLATLDFVPVITTFAVFAVSRDLDQIRMLISQNQLNVKIAGAYSGLLAGKTGKTHISVDDLAIMRALPHMTVLAPADNTELNVMLRWMLETPGPTYIRLARDESPTIFGDDYHLNIGGAVVIRQGTDVAVISTGVQTTRCIEALDLLAAQGINAKLIHIPAIKPLHAKQLVKAIGDVTAVVTVEEHSIIGGLGSAVAEVLVENKPMPVLRVGIKDTYAESAANAHLLDKYGLSPERIAGSIESFTRRFAATLT